MCKGIEVWKVGEFSREQFMYVLRIKVIQLFGDKQQGWASMIIRYWRVRKDFRCYVVKFNFDFELIESY